MDQKMKQELKAYYNAPKPLRKQEFIRSVKSNKTSFSNTLFVHCSYISKQTWCFSLLFFIGSLLIGRYLPTRLLGVIYSFVPFLVMISIIECVRSSIYGMSELEMSTRFSLKSIVMMRMCILGIGNIVLLILIVLLCNNISWYTIIYMFVPYLTTAFISLKILRLVRAKEGTYYCAGVAIFISLISFIIYEQYSFVYTLSYLGIWCIACFLLLLLTINEGYLTIRMTEDILWN